MPITKSAKKALRQNKKRRSLNNLRKKNIKQTIKKIKFFVSEKKIDEAKKLIPIAYKAIDKAVKSGLIKKNAGSRKKSKTAKMVKQKN